VFEGIDRLSRTPQDRGRSAPQRPWTDALDRATACTMSPLTFTPDSTGIRPESDKKLIPKERGEPVQPDRSLYRKRRERLVRGIVCVRQRDDGNGFRVGPTGVRALVVRLVERGRLAERGVDGDGAGAEPGRDVRRSAVDAVAAIARPRVIARAAGGVGRQLDSALRAKVDQRVEARAVARLRLMHGQLLAGAELNVECDRPTDRRHRRRTDRTRDRSGICATAATGHQRHDQPNEYPTYRGSPNHAARHAISHP